MRPLLSLVMIVKDEAKSIEAVLNAVKPHIDRWTILDTGSTDDTQNIVRRIMASAPGVLHEEPFIDFGTSRNRVMELASSETTLGFEPAEFQLMLSGDEYLRNGEKLREHLEKYRGNSKIDCHAVKLVIDDTSMLRPWVFRTGSGWKFEGEIHEFPANRQVEGAPIAVVEGAFIEHVVSDPERRLAAIWENHIPHFKRKLEENEDDERSLIFLAQSYEALFPTFSKNEQLMYALEAMGLLMRRLAIKTGNETERNWCKLQYLDFARLTGVYTDSEMFIRIAQLAEEDPTRPEVALLLAKAAIKAQHADEVYKLACHAAAVAEAANVPGAIDTSSPMMTTCGVQAHYLAAATAKQLAKKFPTKGPREGVTWTEVVSEHIAAGLKCPGGRWEVFSQLMDLPPVREESQEQSA